MKMKTSEKIIRAKKDFIEYGIFGMCASFEDVGYPILFNYYIAILFFGARTNSRWHHWWPTDNRKIRLKYFDWMIRIYKFFGK